MDSYFTPLGFNILSNQTVERVREYVLAHPSEVVPRVASKTGEEYGLYYISGRVFTYARTDIAKLMKLCNIRWTYRILCMQPMSSIRKHIDVSKKDRECAIMQPIHPLADYKPTLWWRSYTDEKPAAVSPVSGAVLCNTQKIHSVENDTPELRMNFQICFSAPYERVLGLLKEGRLFKEAPAPL